MTMTRSINRMRPVHPDEVPREDFLAPIGLFVNVLAQSLGVPVTRIHEIAKERCGITADTTTERLARYFGGDAVSWLVMQAGYALKTLPAREEIKRIVCPRSEKTAAV
jgi:addiction module HigA family antidote